MGIERQAGQGDATAEDGQLPGDGASTPDMPTRDLAVVRDGPVTPDGYAVPDAAADSPPPLDSASECPGDSCAPDPCEGVVCNAPPPNTCQGSLRLTYGSGVCEGGECTYEPSTFACPAGCTGAQCNCFTQVVTGSCQPDGLWFLTAHSFCQSTGLRQMSYDFNGIAACAGGDGGSTSHDRANVECCP